MKLQRFKKNKDAAGTRYDGAATREESASDSGFATTVVASEAGASPKSRFI